jgi:hypothetical protein
MNTIVGAGLLRLVTDRPTPPNGETRDTRSASDDPHPILAGHLPNPDGTACARCDFGYSKDRPLCPPVAQALRTLTAGAHMRSFSDYSVEQLRAMEREHCGAGRCRRCGFVYTPRVRLCPTSRRIAIELESRFKAPMSEVRAGQGLCSGKGQAWTVSGNKSAPWRQAVAACAQCPLLTQCNTNLERRLASGEKIQDQILAGRLFSNTGTEVDRERFDTYADRRGMKTRDRNRRPPRRRQKAQCVAVARTEPAPTVGEQLALFESVAA